MGRFEGSKKWSLVSWKDLVKSKTKGGLGLRDPYILKKAMGFKLWWHWMNGGNDLWKRICTNKNNIPTKPKEILRIRDTLKGSTTGNLASLNKKIITSHAFQEIRDGSSARCWEEAWKQRERLNKLQSPTNICQKVAENGMNLVTNFWKMGS